MHFYKYQATGNDFVLVDNRENTHYFTKEQIGKICDRRFGIGADGLILIQKSDEHDFGIVYYNGDGTQSLCGNGCRSAVELANRLGLIQKDETSFLAYDGVHDASLFGDQIRLHMSNVNEIKEVNDGYFLNTGSPHFVRFVKNLKEYPVVEEGRKLRYHDDFKPAGTNANFVEMLDDNTLFVRTYERGVEDETYSCGTGVTAVSLVASLKGYSSPVKIKVTGGNLAVEFKTSQSGTFEDIYLIGPAKLVYEGDLEL